MTTTAPDWWDALQDVFVLRDEFEDLQFEHLIFIIVISTVILLALVLLVILYCWLYKVEKKLKVIMSEKKVDYTIRRAHIREDFQSQSPKPFQPPQNPLSRSQNFSSVVDDLNKRTPNPPNPRDSRYPNYIGDNNNFIY